MSISYDIVEDLRMWRTEMPERVGRISLLKHILFSLYVNPGFACVFAYRMNRALARFMPRAAVLMAVWRHYTFGNDISYNADIGPGFQIGHTSDVVIGKGVVIGARCVVYNGVTIGARRFDRLNEKPSIGNNVIIGTGAKILGEIRIGNDARIGALTLCMIDVPDGATAVGVPARIV